MSSHLATLFPAIVLLVLLLGVIVYSVALQRKAVGTQDGAVTKVDESLALGRDSIQRQNENLALVQELVALQKETNRLLTILVNEGSNKG